MYDMFASLNVYCILRLQLRLPFHIILFQLMEEYRCQKHQTSPTDLSMWLRQMNRQICCYLRDSLVTGRKKVSEETK